MRYGWRLSADALGALAGHLAARGLPFERGDGFVTLTDPFGIVVAAEGRQPRLYPQLSTALISSPR